MPRKSARTATFVSPRKASIARRAQSVAANLDDPSVEPPRKKRKYTKKWSPSGVVDLKTTEKHAQKVASAKKRAEDRKNEAAIVLRTNADAAIEAARRRSTTNSLIEALHAQGELQRALEFSENPKAAAFLADMGDPKYSKWTTSALASKHGFSASMINDLWRSHMLTQANIEFVKAAPEVSKDVVEDARSTKVSCPRCDGFGRIAEEYIEEVPGGEPIVRSRQLKCPNCKGMGLVRKPGDSDSRKLMYEVIGLAGRRSGGGTTTNITLPSVSSLIDDDDALTGRTINITTNP